MDNTRRNYSARGSVVGGMMPWPVRAICFLWLSIWPVAASGQFDFVTNNGSILITRYTGAGGAVTIPDTLNTLPVTCLGDGAFNVNGNANITSIAIPDTVTNLGTGTFAFCTGLTRMTIPKGVRCLGMNLFASCHNLTNVLIPEGVTSLGSNTFNNCFALPTVAIPDSVTNLAYCASAGVAHAPAGRLVQKPLVQKPFANLTSI